MTHYDRLGVARNAPPEVIAAAYKALARIYHPDQNGGDGSKMKLVNAAYAVLKDPQKRAAYDETLQVHKAERKAKAPARKNGTAQANGMFVEYQSTGNDGLDYLLMQMQGPAIQFGAELLNQFAQQNPLLDAVLKAAQKGKK